MKNKREWVKKILNEFSHNQKTAVIDCGGQRYSCPYNTWKITDNYIHMIAKSDKREYFLWIDDITAISDYKVKR